LVQAEAKGVFGKDWNKNSAKTRKKYKKNISRKI